MRLHSRGDILWMSSSSMGLGSLDRADLSLFALICFDRIDLKKLNAFFSSLSIACCCLGARSIAFISSLSDQMNGMSKSRSLS